MSRPAAPGRRAAPLRKISRLSWPGPEPREPVVTPLPSVTPVFSRLRPAAAAWGPRTIRRVAW